MSKKLKEDTNLEEDLSTISSEINKLGKFTKLKDIFKKSKDTKMHIVIATEKLTAIQKLFESEIEESNEIIDDETYEKYSKDITETAEIDADDFIVETLVKKYRSITKKIICCENYLKSKKMEITYCDKKDDNCINEENF